MPFSFSSLYPRDITHTLPLISCQSPLFVLVIFCYILLPVPFNLCLFAKENTALDLIDDITAAPAFSIPYSRAISSSSREKRAIGVPDKKTLNLLSGI